MPTTGNRGSVISAGGGAAAVHVPGRWVCRVRAPAETHPGYLWPPSERHHPTGQSGGCCTPHGVLYTSSTHLFAIPTNLYLGLMLLDAFPPFPFALFYLPYIHLFIPYFHTTFSYTVSLETAHHFLICYLYSFHHLKFSLMRYLNNTCEREMEDNTEKHIPSVTTQP